MRSEQEIRERIKNLENGTQLMREDSLFAEYIYFNKILIAVLEWVLEDTDDIHTRQPIIDEDKRGCRAF